MTSSDPQARSAADTDVDFELSSNVNYLLRRAHGRADALFHQEMSDLGLTPRQAALLYAVARSDGGSISALSRMTGMDRGTLSEMIPRLIRRGLLSRRRDETDGRATWLFLTDEGARLVRVVNGRTTELRERVLQPLPHEYRELFTKMLTLMIGLESQADTRN